jgi:hypothetical protein
MEPLSRLVFFAVVSSLFVHELDANRRHEWRSFVASLPVGDETAYRLFTALHAPLFVVLRWLLDAPRVQIDVDVFVVVHALAHFGLRGHPLLAFENWFSRLWIGGDALLGVLHLALVV